jgi:hypothetical protein
MRAIRAILRATTLLVLAAGLGCAMGMNSPPETTTYQASRTFWVNSEGIIYRWAWKGL